MHAECMAQILVEEYGEREGLVQSLTCTSCDLSFAFFFQREMLMPGKYAISLASCKRSLSCSGVRLGGQDLDICTLEHVPFVGGHLRAAEIYLLICPRIGERL